MLLGESFNAGSTVEIGSTEYSLEAVPQERFQGDTFALWVNYYGALGPSRPESRALQLSQVSSLRLGQELVD